MDSLHLLLVVITSVVVATEAQNSRASSGNSYHGWDKSILIIFQRCDVHLVDFRGGPSAKSTEIEWMAEIIEFYEASQNYEGSFVVSSQKNYSRSSKVSSLRSWQRRDYTRGFHHPTDCYVQLYQASYGSPSLDPRLPSSFFSALPSYLQRMPERPDFVVIFVASTGACMDPAYRLIVLRFQPLQLGMHTKFLLACQNKTLLMISVGKHNAAHELGNIRSLGSLKDLWHQLHLNMQLAEIGYSNINSIQSKNNCHVLDYHRMASLTDVTPQSCLLVLLEEYFNLTLIISSHSYHSRAVISHGSILHPVVLDLITQGSNSLRTSELRGGQVIQRFSIALVWLGHDLQLSAFLHVFEWKTWTVLLAFSAYLIATFTGIASRRSPSVSLATLLKVAVAVYGYLIEISVLSRRRVQQHVNLQGAILFFVWCQTAAIISNQYRGSLYSFLAAKPLPAMPQSIEEIAHFPNFVFSNSHFQIQNGDKISTINVTVMHVLNRSENDSAFNRIWNQRLAEFAYKVHFETLNISELILSQFPSYSFTADANFHLPLSHIYVGTEDDVAQYASLSRILDQKRRTILVGPPLPLFIHRFSLLLTGPLFAKEIEDVAGRIVETGLWDRLEMFSARSVHLKSVQHIQREVGTQVKCKHFSRRGKLNNAMALLFENGKGLHRLDSNGMEESLQLSALSGVFILGIGLTIVASAVFIGEYVKCERK